MSITPTPQARKAALHTVHAGHRFLKSGVKGHGVRCYMAALEAYKCRSLPPPPLSPPALPTLSPIYGRMSMFMDATFLREKGGGPHIVGRFLAACLRVQMPKFLLLLLVLAPYVSQWLDACRC